MKKQLLLALCCLFIVQSIFAQYPFSLPQNLTATVNIDTQSQENFNNLLLGTNTISLHNGDGIPLIKEMDPVTLRFPHGLFSNWYDWGQDHARVFGGEVITFDRPDGSQGTVEINFLDAIKRMDQNELLVGINELTQANNERKAEKGKGYDMMWTFNMSADGTNFNNGSPVSVARYQDLVARGLEVKTIELGNENFFPSQRSTIIPNPSQYVARARSISTALKALDPNLKISVNIGWRTNNVDWNEGVTGGGTDYFDAFTIHRYIGHDPDFNEDSNEAFSTALTAREVLRETVDTSARLLDPSKPVWLTEWGVRSGGPNAVSALGMLDCYMFMSENQNVYERAQWFSINGNLNPHLVKEIVNPNGRPSNKRPFEKNAYGAAYGILTDTYRNSTMLKSQMQVHKLDGKVNVVNARAVTKDGETTVFVINMANRPVPFNINVNGSVYNEGFIHKALSFSHLGQEIEMPFNDDPLTLIKNGSGAILLPKLSVSTIVLKGLKPPTISFIEPSGNRIVTEGYDLSTLVQATDEDGSIDNVKLLINGSLVRQENFIPYEWGHAQSPDPEELNGLTPGLYRFRAIATDNDGLTAETSFVLNVQAPEITIESVDAVQVPNFAVKLLDGDTSDSSRWSAFGFPKSVVFDLGAERQITGTKMWTYQDRAYQYRVQTSNSPNSGFVTRANRTGNTSNAQPHTTGFNVSARYVKLTVTGAHNYSGGWVSINEFEILTAANANNNIVDNDLDVQLNRSQIAIYPNPASDHFTIDLKDVEATSVTILNMQGQQVYENTKKERRLTIPIANRFSKGVYIIRVTDQNQEVHINKLIIN